MKHPFFEVSCTGLMFQTKSAKRQKKLGNNCNMQTRHSNDIKQAFIFSPDDLKKLVEVIKRHIEVEEHIEIYKISITAYCRDGIIREFETIEELTGYENPKSEEIRAIHTSFYVRESPEHVVIRFDSGSNWSSVNIYIKGSEYLIFTLNKKIKTLISGMRPWYSPLSGNKFLILVAFIIGIVYNIPFNYWIHPIVEKNISPIHEIFIFIIPLVVLAIPFIIFVQKVINYLFPKAVFLIGQGKGRFEHSRKVLKWIIGLTTTIVGGLTIWLLTK